MRERPSSRARRAGHSRISGSRRNSDSAISSNRLDRACSCSGARARGSRTDSSASSAFFSATQPPSCAGAHGQHGQDSQAAVEPEGQGLVPVGVVGPERPPDVGQHLLVGAHGHHPRRIEPQPLGYQQLPGHTPEVLTISFLLASPRFEQWHQVGIRGLDNHRPAHFRVVAINERISGGFTHTVKTVNDSPPVRADVPQITQTAQGNGGRGNPAGYRGSPGSWRAGYGYAAAVDQGQCAAQHVAAGKLAAVPAVIGRRGRQAGYFTDSLLVYPYRISADVVGLVAASP